MQPQVFFSSTESGQRFNILYPAERETPLGTVVYVHPFAEEMNKSRRMAALQSRRLAEAGFTVLQVDLHGCGDSSDDFGNATWSGWVQDVVEACQRALAHSPAPLWLWGLRAGCLIAVQAAHQLEAKVNFVLWAPPSNGLLLLQQFLRLKLASDMLTGNAKGGMDALRKQLAEGHPVEIAGYKLSANLADGLGAATLLPPKNPGYLVWLEVSTKPDATLTPAAAKTLTQWREAGTSIHSEVVHGPTFWQTTEIEVAPALEQATIDGLQRASGERMP